MFVSPRFRDFLGSDPTTAYLSDLAAAAGRIDPYLGEGDTLLRDEPIRAHFTPAYDAGRGSAPVFIPAPVCEPEFIPAPVFESEFIPAQDPTSRRR